MIVKKDYKLPPEWRKHQSEGQIRRYQTQPHPFKGHPLTEKWRNAISTSLLQYHSEHEVWNKGLHIHSEETRHHISESCIRSGVGKFHKYRKRKLKTED